MGYTHARIILRFFHDPRPNDAPLVLRDTGSVDIYALTLDDFYALTLEEKLSAA